MTADLASAPPRIPAVITASRTISAAAVAAQASVWRDELTVIGGTARPLLVVVPAHPDAVALIAAVTALPSWVALLNPDPTLWPKADQWPPGLLAVVPAGLTHQQTMAAQMGLPVHVLSPVADAPRAHDAAWAPLSGEGVVLFTSGSTGAAKPVFRSMRALLQGCRSRIAALGLQPGEGVVAGTSLAHGGGLNRLIEAMCLGGAFGMLDAVDHRAALAVLARPEFGYWSVTAHFADALSRCALTGPPIVPRVCTIANTLPRPVYDRFLARFGVPIRQIYSSTETGPVSTDGGPAADVDPESVGFLMPGVEVRIGDDVQAPLPAGEVGRVWLRGPWQMSGYGFPPHLTRPGDVDGWWPTRDLGALKPDGRLRLAGRIDDCVRTREGRLVNLAIVTGDLRLLTGVQEAMAVAIPSSAGTAFGAVVQCDAGVSVTDLHAQMTHVAPWARPRTLVQVDAMPRLPNGKIDRRACARLLDR